MWATNDRNSEASRYARYGTANRQTGTMRVNELRAHRFIPCARICHTTASDSVSIYLYLSHSLFDDDSVIECQQQSPVHNHWLTQEGAFWHFFLRRSIRFWVLSSTMFILLSRLQPISDTNWMNEFNCARTRMVQTHASSALAHQ